MAQSRPSTPEMTVSDDEDMISRDVVEETGREKRWREEDRRQYKWHEDDEDENPKKRSKRAIKIKPQKLAFTDYEDSSDDDEGEPIKVKVGPIKKRRKLHRSVSLAALVQPLIKPYQRSAGYLMNKFKSQQTQQQRGSNYKPNSFKSKFPPKSNQNQWVTLHQNQFQPGQEDGLYEYKIVENGGRKSISFAKTYANGNVSYSKFNIPIDVFAQICDDFAECFDQ